MSVLIYTVICLTGYVEQFDTLLPELTVAEMLLYTAELKCPVSVRPLCCLVFVVGRAVAPTH